MSAEPQESRNENGTLGDEGAELESSNYEIIRARLVEQARELHSRASELNGRRQELFGTTEMTVIGQDRIRTANNCVPQDIVNVGGRLLFGYNVFFGLKSETHVDDVFSVHDFTEKDGVLAIGPALEPAETFLGEARFGRDFQDLYAYYKDARLRQLAVRPGKLLAAFQVGSTIDDLRVLRWGLDRDATYIDNGGDRDIQPPPAFDFEWRPVTRASHVAGMHPHVSIEDEVFVETVGGDLTIKIENNTQDGKGIYNEPVDDPHQALGDAEISYARLGALILLRILPYREEKRRYFVFNTLTQSVRRVDSIGQACRRLPDDQGIIFPGGYMLSDGPAKTFEADVESMRFHESIRSPNGEDMLFVFHRPHDGRYLLLSFNVIQKEVQNPIACHGYSIFDDGTMIVFRFQGEEATRVHPMQIWQTPYFSDEHAAAQPKDTSFLANLGNAELVKGISDVFTLCRMIDEQQPTLAIYEAVITATQNVLDNYFWLENGEAGDIASVLHEVVGTAELVIDEFQKVNALKAQAASTLEALEERQKDVLRDLRYHDWKRIERFVEALGNLRQQRGRLISARETRFIDVARLEELENEIAESFERLSKNTVEFLLKEDSLRPYRDGIAETTASVETLQNTVEAEALREKLDEMNEALNLLTEVVSGLKVDDPNKRTQMLENIGEILGLQNRSRAMLENRRRSLLEREGKAEFAVQFQLLGQSVTSSLGMAETPEACDEMLTRTMVQLEEMESRFSAFDMFLEQLAEKRDEIYEVFESKKQSLLEARQRKAHNMQRAAARIIDGIVRRAASMKSVEDLNAYFAADAMVMKVRDIATGLRELGDDVSADDVDTQLKASRDQAIRQLRDKLDLFEGGANLIKFGRHRFSVNSQQVELTAVPRDEAMALHITGTQFYETIADATYQATKPFWSQHLVSETSDVYRGEFLAVSLLRAAESGALETTLAELQGIAHDEAAVLKVVRRAIEDRYDEGYERGVHDVDAAKILGELVATYTSAGLLRFSGRVRAVATLFWAYSEHPELARWARRGASFGRLRSHFEHGSPMEELAKGLSTLLEAWLEETGLGESLAVAPSEARAAGRYLAEELANAPLRFVTSGESADFVEEFQRYLSKTNAEAEFIEDLDSLNGDLRTRLELVGAWMVGYARRVRSDEALDHLIVEAASLLVTEDSGVERIVSASRGGAKVEGLLGQHPRIRDGVLALRIDEVLGRVGAYLDEHVPAYRAYRHATHEMLQTQRERLRLDELKPRVLSTFVRNRLIDEVYLPLIGDNLAKQLGAAGEEGRSDRSGLLLLISPPGYGKTTLMEYVASRLGLMFMKVNGPSLGHDVVSLDPAQAPNATARQEVEKVNLALEMGNNVMLYVDDIQHTHPEFLQKFISLCDATRRIEGVWRGKTRTYDLRGKRFAVVMAGNPYTESGERFTIPDMLANRADTYNLGDILSGNEGAFEMSYVENSLTSNKVTAALATRPRGDIDKFARMARGETIPVSELEHPYASVEAGEIVSVFRKMLAVRDVVLAVNKQYIKSAAMMDEYRTEPAFQLQGSYRNMNKMVEKIASAMNDDEIQRVIDNHYNQESQTLTTGSEQNLLKLKELRERMSDDERARWEAIKREFNRRKLLGGEDDDPVARVVGPLSGLVERLADVHDALKHDGVNAQLESIKDALNQAVVAAQAAPVPAASRGTDDGWSEALDDLQNARLEVQVVGDLPARLTETLEHQLGIIESALVPLARAIQSHFDQNERTNLALTEIIERLEAMESPGPRGSAE